MKILFALNIARNMFAVFSALMIIVTIFLGALLTNQEIKSMGEIAVISAIISGIIQCFCFYSVKFKSKQKRGITFNK